MKQEVKRYFGSKHPSLFYLQKINEIENNHNVACYLDYKNNENAGSFYDKKYKPNLFETTYLSKLEGYSFFFNEEIGKWMSKSEEMNLERTKFVDFSQKINKELLKKYADFSSAAKLVELLQKIPNFKIHLTEQEKDVIGQSGNVLAIGRSGTGKTTCALLRLFSMEILFKMRLSLYKNKHENILKDTRFSADDIDKNIGLHCVFATASPILTNEVQRYYNKLTKQVKDQLQKKKEKLKAMKKLKEEEELKKKKNQENIIEESYEKIETNEVKELDKHVEEHFNDIKIGCF